MSDAPIYYTLEQVSEMFGLTGTYYLRGEVSARRVPHVRMARQIRFTAEHIEEIGRSHFVEPVASPTPANTFGRRTRGGTA